MSHGIEIIIAINKMEDPDRYMLQSSGAVKIERGKKPKMAKRGKSPSEDAHGATNGFGCGREGSSDNHPKNQTNQ